MEEEGRRRKREREEEEAVPPPSASAFPPPITNRTPAYAPSSGYVISNAEDTRMKSGSTATTRGGGRREVIGSFISLIQSASITGERR